LYKLIIESKAQDFYQRLYTADRSHFSRIAAAFESLKRDPYRGKPLKLSLKGSFSLRVGMYRIIYEVEQNTVTVYVLKIGHRRDVYN
jgi:mRNA interferase RelE/StbE